MKGTVRSLSHKNMVLLVLNYAKQAFQHEDSRQSNDELYMLGFVMKYQHPENRAGATTEQRQREQRPFRDTPGALSGHFLVCPEHRERDDAHKRRAQK